VWVGVDKVVEVVRGWSITIEQGRGFSPQNGRYRVHTLGVGGRLAGLAERALMMCGLG
jgi:hypothetical protein